MVLESQEKKGSWRGMEKRKKKRVLEGYKKFR